MTQVVGLSEKGAKLVESKPALVARDYVTRVFLKDGRIQNFNKEVWEESVVKFTWTEIEGMYDDVVGLTAYNLPDGQLLREHVQLSPWSSGPMFFFALKDRDGNWIPESLWTTREVWEVEPSFYDVGPEGPPEGVIAGL